MIDSANDFGDDEEDEDSSASESDSDSDASSTRSGRSRAATPLLSSSLPYDPQSEHPHHEQQSLLQHNFRRMSYNTLNLNFNEPVPVPWDSNVDGDTESDVQVLIRDNSRDGVVTIQPDGLSPQRPRAYPSYPSYSASYNHSHFSTPPGPSNFQQQQQQQSQQQPQRSIIHRISSISSASSPRPQLLPIVPPSQAQQHIQNRRPSKMPTRHYVRMIYGVSVNSLPLYLPIMWRLGATLRGLANALLFAWFPELIYKGKFQFFTLLVVGFIATKKGWYTVDWVGGGVVRSGILKISSMTLVIQTATYLIALGLWSIIFY